MLTTVVLSLVIASVNGCGQMRNQKIVGGSTASAQKYPWYVALVSPSSGPNNIPIECGATLISKSHILTAAHCFRSIPPALLSNAYKAIFILEDRCAGRSSFTSRLSMVTVHPNFNPNTLKNDIAVAKLERDVNFEPVCLPAARSRNGGKGTIIGYGNTRRSGQNFPCNLQEANVNVYSWNSCLNTGNLRNIMNLPKVICAGYRTGGVDTCNGDSGGPLLQIGGDGKLYIKGITSFGNGCANPNNPGVYTDVSKYLGWVLKAAGLPRTVTQTYKTVTVSAG